MRCFKNAQESSQVTLLDRAFHYGDGCFTTARLRGGQLELKAQHIARLKLASERLFLNADLHLIEQSLSKIIEQDSNASGTVKIILSRGDGQRGYSLPDHPADVWLFYYPQPAADMQLEYLDCGLLQQRIGINMPNLAGLKTLNRLEQVMLKQEADEHGWKEALAADVQGFIAEGVSSNCFIRIKDRWISPELRYNGVHGVMRAEILARMHEHGIVCELRPVALTEIADIQSLFFCNALSAMKAASHLDGVPLDTQACTDLFHILQLNQIR
ncbi:aminodeoxychorismate lyase [Acinetobacter tianfuensis]|uniref:Aminodeoxychorismate lyase n=1 Tax=Acinetobacter tianfuensis TaxID=2419603 RepID=A0A3A8E8R9_9GAMM|nr:aminodeoxychorismate lyase [Acinetobacter tianfuensis]RKG31412.1 aminodeoxychorismate lyase [Acinetobacter tianfuensis]